MGRGTSRTRRLAVTLGVNVALAIGQAIAGVLAHSTGLLADAGHNVTDVAGITMSLVAVRCALRPRSPSHSFGYHRGTILAALANAAVIAAVTVAIVVMGIARLLHPRPVHGGRRGGRGPRWPSWPTPSRPSCSASGRRISTCAARRST